MKYSERIIGVTAGRIVYDGPTANLTQDVIHEIYQSSRARPDHRRAGGVKHMQITKQTKANLDIFQRRKITYTLVFLVLIAVFAGASLVSEFNLLDGVASFPAAMQWIISNLIPDAEAIERIPKILSELMGDGARLRGGDGGRGGAGLLLQPSGLQHHARQPVVKRVVRIVAAFFRNVPDVVWAMLLMFSFGQNILTGFFALFFTTFGLLTRAFIETIDEVSSGCVEALDATGANFLQKVFQGILPSSHARASSPGCST